MHYKRWRNHGSVEAQRTARFTEADFWQRVQKGPDCWLWTGKTIQAPGKKAMYGVFGKRMAHRYSFTLAYEREPVGEVDHRCRNTMCVNPDHLEDVTSRENRRRASVYEYAGTCMRGHPLSVENTYVTPATGHRRCRVCRRLHRSDR